MSERPLGSGPGRASTAVAVAALGAIAVLLAAGVALDWPLARPLGTVGRLLRSLVSLGSLLAAVLAIGMPIERRWLRDGGASRLERLLAALVAGAAVVSLAGMVLLAAGTWHEIVWPAAVLAGAVAFVLQRGRELGRLAGALRDVGRELGELRTTAVADLLLALVLAAALCAALLPPDSRDERHVHLALPQQWSFDHDWTVRTDNFHWSFPATAEIFLGAARAVAGMELPRMLTLAFGVGGLLLLRLALRDAGAGRWAAGAALAFVAATPVLAVPLAVCYVEWPLAFFLLAGWRAARRHATSGEPGAARLAALAWGVALGIKYTAWAFVGLLALEWGIACVRGRGLRAAARPLGWLALGAVLLGAPWLARNLAATGDPLFPLLGIGQGAGLAYDRAALVDYAEIPASLRWFPWLHHATLERVADHRLHPGWPVLLVAVLGLGWRRARDLPWLTVAVGTALLFRHTPAPRVYFPLLLLSTPFLGAGLEALAGTRGRRWLAALVVASCVAGSLPFALHHWFFAGAAAAPDYLLGTIGVERYLVREGVLTPALVALREQAPPRARVWVWCDDRVLWLERPVGSDAAYGEPAFARLAGAGGARALAEALEAGGFDAVAIRIDRCPLDFSVARMEKRSWPTAPAEAEAVRGFVRDRLEPVAADGTWAVFRRRRGATIPP